MNRKEKEQKPQGRPLKGKKFVNVKLREDLKDRVDEIVDSTNLPVQIVVSNLVEKGLDSNMYGE